MLISLRSKLDRAELAEQVTALELLNHFELIDGFWGACVEMTAPASKDLPNLRKRKKKSHKWKAGSKEQILENGIRDRIGDLTASFCFWFDNFCDFNPALRTRNFLLSHLRPAEFAERRSDMRTPPKTHTGATTPPKQLHTKFANAVIQAMKLPADLPASEIYPDFVRKALELADEEQWGQGLRAEIEHGSGHLLIFYTSKGPATPVNKTITPRRFAGLLSVTRDR